MSVVLVERADRLARDLVVGELILNQFRELGVKVIAADSGTDLTAGDVARSVSPSRYLLGASICAVRASDYLKIEILIAFCGQYDRSQADRGRLLRC